MWPFETSFPTYKASDVGVAIPYNEDALNEFTYDYIIIGGGTAGCVLASRLSETQGVTVLVIERGRAANDWTDRVPLISADLRRKASPSATWSAEPMKCVRNRTMQLVTGEGLGGGSLVNSAVYTRGTRGDWNRWNQPGWTYDELLGYFKKSEKCLGHPASSYRSTRGPWVNDTFPDFKYEVFEYFRDASVSLGIPHVEDINAPDAPASASSLADLTIDNGSRHSTAAAFLPKSLCLARKSQLKLCTKTLARKLDIETTKQGSLRARGVFIEDAVPSKDNKVYYVRARREVILSAGALATPQILMLSGVGPREYLQSQGIDVLHDLQGVGSNLQDHYSVPVSYGVPLHDSLHKLLVSPLSAMLEFLKFVVLGTGILGAPFQHLSLFYQTSLLNDKYDIVPSKAGTTLDPSDNMPDIEIMPVPCRCSEDVHDELDKVGIFTFLTCLVKPKSFGSVRLSSTNPRDRPRVDLNFLSHPSDLETLRKAVKFDMRIGDEMRRKGYPLENTRIPASDSDKDIDDFILTHLRMAFHYSSSCRMAPINDARPGVVDHELKVHGIDCLRICDTSIFPEILGTHTMAPVVVVAEKCADMIKDAHSSA